jgi:hypothetical protein
MGKQIYWVLRTYLANKLFLTLVSIVGLWCLFGVFQAFSPAAPNQSNIPAPPRGRLVVYSLDSLEAVRRGHLENEVDAISLGNLWSSMERARQDAAGKAPDARYSISPPPESFYEVLDEFPNLRIVRFDTFWPAQGFERLANRREIKYLTLGGIGLNDISPVAKMTGLERLDLEAYQPVTGYEQLANLPTLTTLVVSSEQALDDEALKQIAALPRLEVFGIRGFSGDSKLTDAGLAQLAAAPHLQTFYVGGAKVPPQFDLLARARKVLPGVNIQPAVVVSRSPWVVGFIPGLLAMGVGAVVASQFTSSASRLAPGFASAHAIVAGGWLLLVMIATCLAFAIARMPLVQAAAFSGAGSTLFFYGGAELIRNRRLGGPVRSTPVQWMMAITVPAIILLAALPGASELAQRWSPVLLVAAVAFGLAVLWQVVEILRSLPGGSSHQKLAQSGAPVPFQPGPIYALAPREELFERWAAEPPRWSPWMCIRRWRAGNPQLRVVPIILLITFGSVAGAYFMQGFNPGTDRSALKINVWLLPLVLLVMVVGQIAFIWRKRVASLDVESLRPIARSTLQRDWALALLLDLATPSLAVGLFVALATSVDLGALELGIWRAALPDWRTVLLAAAVLTAVAWIVTAAVATLAVVIERAWVRLIAFLSLLALCSLGPGIALGLRVSNSPVPIGLWDVLPLLWMPTVLCALVAVWMWRMWTRIDFDRRS